MQCQLLEFMVNQHYLLHSHVIQNVQISLLLCYKNQLPSDIQDIITRVFNCKLKALQNDLKLLGYYKGDIDGMLSAETLAAIERYKKQNKIPQETEIERVGGVIAAEAAMKSLDNLKQLFEEGSAPKPPLRK